MLIGGKEVETEIESLVVQNRAQTEKKAVRGKCRVSCAAPTPLCPCLDVVVGYCCQHVPLLWWWAVRWWDPADLRKT